MSDTLYLTSAFMSKDEYLERRDREDALQLLNHVRLKEITHHSQDLFSEEQIPNIIADAAETLGMNTGQLDPGNYPVDDWPFDLKVTVMAYGKYNWQPPLLDLVSEWRPEARWAAQALFEETPELRDIFHKTPQEVGKAWAARNEQAQPAPAP